MSSLKYSHMAIACRDFAAVEAFYTKHFGFRRSRAFELNPGRLVFLKCGDAYLELFEASGQSPAPAATNDGPTYPGWRHIAFQVDDVDAKLAEMGPDAKITLGPLDFGGFIPGWRTVWVADPDGNIVEISQGYTDDTSSPSAA